MTTNKDHAEAAFAEFFDVEFAGQFRRAVFLLRDRGAAEDVVHVAAERQPAGEDLEQHDAAADELSDILARLPFNQRCAVVLRFYVGMSNDEIAHAMGCPVGSVGPWIQRAKQQLLKELT